MGLLGPYGEEIPWVGLRFLKHDVLAPVLFSTAGDKPVTPRIWPRVVDRTLRAHPMDPKPVFGALHRVPHVTGAGAFNRWLADKRGLASRAQVFGLSENHVGHEHHYAAVWRLFRAWVQVCGIDGVLGKV